MTTLTVTIIAGSCLASFALGTLFGIGWCMFRAMRDHGDFDPHEDRDSQ